MKIIPTLRASASSHLYGNERIYLPLAVTSDTQTACCYEDNRLLCVESCFRPERRAGMLTLQPFFLFLLALAAFLHDHTILKCAILNVLTGHVLRRALKHLARCVIRTNSSFIIFNCIILVILYLRATRHGFYWMVFLCSCLIALKRKLIDLNITINTIINIFTFKCKADPWGNWLSHRAD